jgi:hypothetical protein
MIKVDGEFYYLDMKNIEKYIFNDGVKEFSVEQESLLDEKNAEIQKTIVNKEDDKYSQVRYDLIKNMLDIVYNSGIQSEEGNITYAKNMDDNSIGSKLIFNTLLINEFVKNKAK